MTNPAHRLQTALLQALGSPRQRRQLPIMGVLIALAVVFVSPLVWLFLTSLKTTAGLAAFPIQWLPPHPQWSNFQTALTMIAFPQYLINTLILAFTNATLTTFSCAMVGFGFARLRGWGKQRLFLLMLSTIMLPPILTAIPTYILVARIGLVGTYWPWILWGIGTSPFITFLFRQFFSSIPKELEEAALIDGCSYWRIFWQIFLPLAKPALATSFILSFAAVWGDWFTPNLFLNQDNTTLAAAIPSGYVDTHGQIFTNVLAAGSLLYIAPIIVVFFFAQRYFVRGIVTSGLK